MAAGSREAARLANLKFRLAGLEADIVAGRQRFVRRPALNGETILLALPMPT